ncbi:hypothetical protein RHGRI_017750 [Rhododendron griersonianum]|uniref:Uncharacterized protein n=1 Tax=Rhododendron griersonianum TaxID=479676 RepID=A0AAV6JYX6_9ERIC|nr:hypothetical protein RHGRI_017750 [Rhododendron griersonianum]
MGACTSQTKWRLQDRVIVPKETKKKVGKSDGFGHASYLRAMTMPVERSSDCHRVRSNTFAFQLSAKLAAKFTSLRKANLECKSNQVTSAA